jgi:hypothetical protein
MSKSLNEETSNLFVLATVLLPEDMAALRQINLGNVEYQYGSNSAFSTQCSRDTVKKNGATFSIKRTADDQALYTTP